MDIKQQVNLIFRDVFDDQSLEIRDETTSKDIEGWDSLAHINLISSLEQQFRIKFALAEISELKNVGEMLTLVQQKLEGPSLGGPQ